MKTLEVDRQFAAAIDISTCVVEDEETGEQVLEIRIPRHDPIVCVTDGDIEKAGVILFQCDKYGITANDTWELLCAAV